MARGSLLRSTAVGALALAYPGETAHAAPALPYSWSGYYFGVEGGPAWGRTTADCTFIAGIYSPCDGLSVPNLSPRGSAFGVDAGADWQYQNWVVGVAGDWSALDAHNTVQFPSTDAAKNASVDQLSSRYDWLGTARGRLGYAAGQSLFYGTAGVAFGRVSTQYVNEAPVYGQSFSTTNDLTGWTAGFGWEYMITQNIGFKLEYLYVDLGRTNLDISHASTIGNVNFAPSPPGSSVLHFDNTLNLVRAGLDFRW